MSKPIERCLQALLVGLSLLGATEARADMLCGGARPPPPAPAPPSPSSSGNGFAQPPKMGALDPSDDPRRTSRGPLLPVEAGMLGGMVLLGSAAGFASRGKKKERP